MHKNDHPRIGLVSFDLDGTLVDSAGEIAEAANRTLDEHGWPRQSEAALTALIGHGARALLSQVVARLAARGTPEAGTIDFDALLARFEHHYANTNGRIGAAYPGAAETLRRLKGAGVRLACVTNKPERLALALLQRHALDTHFDLLVGGETLPQRKPHPRVLQHVSEACAVPLAAVAHVGDSAVDVQAARAAGVRAWAVPWGYNGGRPIEEAAPDRVFTSLPAVAAHVLDDPAA